MDNRRRVVARVLAGTGGITKDGCAKYVIGVRVGATDALVHHIGNRKLGVPAHVHSHLKEHGDDARVLTDRAMPLGTHAGIDQDLRHRILRSRVLFHFPGFVHGLHEIYRVVVGNKLERVCDAINEIVLTDNGHGASPLVICVVSLSRQLPAPAWREAVTGAD